MSLIHFSPVHHKYTQLSPFAPKQVLNQNLFDPLDFLSLGWVACWTAGTRTGLVVLHTCIQNPDTKKIKFLFLGVSNWKKQSVYKIYTVPSWTASGESEGQTGVASKDLGSSDGLQSWGLLWWPSSSRSSHKCTHAKVVCDRSGRGSLFLRT